MFCIQELASDQIMAQIKAQLHLPDALDTLATLPLYCLLDWIPAHDVGEGVQAAQ